MIIQRHRERDTFIPRFHQLSPPWSRKENRYQLRRSHKQLTIKNDQRRKDTMSRTNEPQEVVKVEAPSWLPAKSAEPDSSLETMQEYRILPRIKVIQATSHQDLIDDFGIGTAILSPGNAQLADKNEQFLFVPVFFFVEFCLWSDLKDKSTPSILERTYDKTSELARRSKDKKLREQIYEGGTAEKPFKRRYVEHLNFAGFVYGEHPLEGTGVVAGFSRGEYYTGTGFINSIQMRRIGGIQVPLWAQVWKFGAAYRNPSDDQKWWGLDVKNPEVPYITDEEGEFYKAQHEELKALHAAQALYVNREDEGQEGDSVVDPTIQDGDEM